MRNRMEGPSVKVLGDGKGRSPNGTPKRADRHVCTKVRDKPSNEHIKHSRKQALRTSMETRSLDMRTAGRI
jgi:hypothetical protein